MTVPLERPAEASVPAYEIRVVSAESSPVVRIDEFSVNRMLVGTSESCAVRLQDHTVSRRHLALEPEADGLRVVDLGSRNGTLVNGVRVESAIVSTHALVEIGRSQLTIDRIRIGRPPPLSDREGFGRVVGRSHAMRRLYPLLERLASSDVPVVIEGETGTGKEAVAEALHEEGDRGSGPFVIFDCTVVPANLMESELFGHRHGAFTGATEDREGAFREAEGGTLFIDEIADLVPSLQSKLLRAIDRRQVRSLGAAKFHEIDVRIVAATRRDLDAEVQAGRFRDDLFHRLAVGRVELPPLRRRRDDIRPLARQFWVAQGGDLSQLTDEQLGRWEDERWPGNVRGLRNAVARALALGELQSAYERETVAEGDGEAAWMERLTMMPLSEARQRLSEEFERRYVRRMLERTGGNVTKAAQAAGVARRYFQVLKARRDQ